MLYTSISAAWVNFVCIFGCDCGKSVAHEKNTQDGLTALMWAVSRAHVDCARLLLDGGADKEAKDGLVYVFCFCCELYLFQ